MQRPEVDLFASQYLTVSSNQPDGTTSKTRAQLLAEERDIRRRRRKYRARNVHLTKRTPTQVCTDALLHDKDNSSGRNGQIARDYINNRMEELITIAERNIQFQPRISFP